jgi:short-subunit dehydrogenase
VRLTHAALPGMVERKHGGVINVSSVAGFQPTPGTATYGGTKAFVTSFSEALHEELKGTGVTVTCLAPGATRTNFQATANYGTSHLPDLAWQTAEEVAAAAIDGLDHHRALVVPGWLNKTLAASTHLAPRALVRRIASAVSHQL